MHVRRLSAMLAVTVLAMLGTAIQASAQNTGSIRGRVMEVGTGRPIPEVQIAVVGTGTGALSTADGTFLITAVPSGARQVRIRRIGFTPIERTVTVTSGQEVVLDLTLTPSVTQLQQFVVTGTSGAVEKRMIGNSITTIDVADLTEKTSVFNVSEVLQSKTPGVTFMPGSGAPGTAGEFRIRGSGSISGYRPVVFIDGIRYNIEQLGNFAATGAGLAGLAQSSQITSAIDFLNPNDIESIEVIKGPAASTLYGAEAANGVIQIITKKGMRGQQRLRWTLRAERGESEWHLKPDDNYTTCDAAKQSAVDATTQQPTWPGCQGIPVNSVITDNPLFRDKQALRVGELSRLSASMRGGGDRYSFFISGDRDVQQGVFFNSDNSNKSARSNFTFNPNQYTDFTINVNWQNTRLRLPMQDESAAGLLLSASRGLAGRATLVGPGGEGWRTIRPERANGYKNFTNSDRLTLGATANFNPFEWFRNRVTIGMDNTASEAQLLFLPGDDGEPSGANSQQYPVNRILTLDYAGTLVSSWGRDWGFTTSLGTQVVATERKQIGATGRGLGAPDVTLIGSAQTTSGSETFSENNSVGYFVEQQVAWRDRLFLRGAVRADDNSSFGDNFDVIVYPKLSLSYVASDEPGLRDKLRSLQVNSLKLRGAWGQAGRAPSPYSATQTYSISVVTLGTNTGSAIRTSSYGNPDLKPERGSEIELGFEAGLFNEKLGADFTWYRKVTSDMLQSISVAPSTGFPTSRLTNLGEVSNTGVELSLFGTPVDRGTVRWDARVTLATNKNELESFGIPGRTSETPGGQAYGAVQQHRVGHPMGGYWAAYPKRNPDGTPMLTPTGAVDTVGQTRYVGPSSPTHEIGLSNTIHFLKYFRVYALLDFKGGHYLFHLRERNRCQTANDNCARVNVSRARFPVTAADTILNKELLVYRTIPAVFIEPADFTKLRELSLTVTAPTAWSRRLNVETASLVLSGRNLALWSDYSGMDPEVNSYGGRNFVRVDAYASPMTRRLSASLNLTF